MLSTSSAELLHCIIGVSCIVFVGKSLCKICMKWTLFFFAPEGPLPRTSEWVLHVDKPQADNPFLAQWVFFFFFLKQNFYRGTEVLCCIDSKGWPSGRHDEVEGDSSRPLLLKDGGWCVWLRGMGTASCCLTINTGNSSSGIRLV